MQGGNGEGARRDVALEAARGIAAIIVVLHHFFLAFAPKFTGFLPSDRTAKSIVGEWYFFVFNGDGAVYFFFVLSGFVLPLAFLRRGDIAVVYSGIVKRLPRLALPVVLVLCFAVFLISQNVYFYADTARVTGSEWLRTAGFAGIPPGTAPSYLDAIRQGLVTFFTGEGYYNSNIWSMKPEFAGSIAVYCILPMLAFSPSKWVSGVIIAILIVLSGFLYAYLIPFIAGLGMSIAFTRRPMEIHWALALGMILVGMYLLGYVASIEYYEWVGSVDRFWTPVVATSLLFGTIGAMLIITALVSSPGVARPLSGRIGYVLGKLSFPIYLLHHPILMSLSCFVLIRSLEGGLTGWNALHVTLAATLGAVFVLAIPLAVIDSYWVKVLNRGTRALMSRLSSRQPVQSAT